MALRLIEQIGERDSDLVVWVYWDAEWEEWQVGLYVDGVEYEPASYRTDDKQDAYLTAIAMWQHETYYYLPCRELNQEQVDAVMATSLSFYGIG